MKIIKKIVALCLLLFLIYIPISYANAEIENEITQSISTSDITTYSPSCLLMETSTGKVLYEKNAHTRMYPASTTKIMTAILVLENCELTDVTTVSQNAVHSIPNGYATANLQIGEQLTISQLLYALLIPSANDAAVVLAEHVAGSVDSFCAMMNTKAIEIGCQDTNFVNPNGIHDENHYSTAYDLALMGRYAMNNSTFRSIVSTVQYALPITNRYFTADRIFSNTNELLKTRSSTSTTSYYYPSCTGIKTGYTDNAKNCIVASAKKDDLEFIVVTLGSEFLENGISARYSDCITLFDYGFENYTFKTLQEENTIVKQVEIINGTKETRHLNLIAENTIRAFVPTDINMEEITPDYSFSQFTAPITKNTIVGTLSYTIDGTTYSTNLLAASDVQPSKNFEYVLTILSVILIFFVIFLLARPKSKK